MFHWFRCRDKHDGFSAVSKYIYPRYPYSCFSYTPCKAPTSLQGRLNQLASNVESSVPTFIHVDEPDQFFDFALQFTTMLTHEEKREAESSTDRTSPSSPVTDEEKAQQAPETFLVDWDGDKDPLDPRIFSPLRKWFYVAVVAMGSLLV